MSRRNKGNNSPGLALDKGPALEPEPTETKETDGTPLPTSATDASRIEELEARLAKAEQERDTLAEDLEKASPSLAPKVGDGRSWLPRELEMAIPFVLTAPRYVREAGATRPETIHASPKAPVRVMLPEFVPVRKDGDFVWDEDKNDWAVKKQPEDHSLFRADSQRARRNAPAPTHRATQRKMGPPSR